MNSIGVAQNIRRCCCCRWRRKSEDELLEESEKLLEMQLFSTYERDSGVSSNSEKLNLFQVLKLERADLNSRIFLLELPGKQTYLQIKKSSIENGQVLQIQDVSDSIV